MKNILPLAILLAYICPNYANTNSHTSKITYTNGEKWWGAMVALGAQMPYGDEQELINIATENRNNQNVPLLVSSGGRYIWSDYPFKFEIANGEILFTSDYEEVKAVKAGETLRDAYLAASNKHMQSTGTLPDPTFFSVPQYNTWIELQYDQNQADILNYAENIKRYNFPAGVFMVDDNWQRYYGNFDFKLERFPDAKAMIEKLHDDGFKIMLWVCPFVSPDSPEFRELNKKGYLIKSKKGGGAAMIRWWNGVSACYDLTNPNAVAHLVGELKRLQQECGVDGYKFDAGDISHFKRGDLLYHQKDATSTDMCQAWAKIGLEFPFNEYRAGWKMGGQPLVQRLGDKDYSWKAVQMLIPGMVSAGLMGYAYTCPDMIGGGQINSFINLDQRELDQELIVRSCQIHALMPMMQFSIAPWRVLDEQHLAIVVKFAELHKLFGNYILQCAKASSVSGEPIVRHMEYSYPGLGLTECKDQFMLGEKFLVAPMTRKGTKRSVVLPIGVWRDDQGKRIVVKQRSKRFEIDVPIERLPYYELIK